eukprot:13310275-Heterocapsa_arctica.AAC.1
MRAVPGASEGLGLVGEGGFIRCAKASLLRSGCSNCPGFVCPFFVGALQWLCPCREHPWPHCINYLPWLGRAARAGVGDVVDRAERLQC